MPGTSVGPSDDGVGDDEDDDEDESDDGDEDDGEDADDAADDDAADDGEADDGEADGGEADGEGDDSQLGGARGLVCTPQPYVLTQRVIGRSGGGLIVGDHSLVIPPGALSEDVTITAQQLPGPVNSVRFRPQGLHFDEPATLTMSYGNCTPIALPKRIVYTDELLRILDLRPSTDFTQSNSVAAPIDHFSRYAVAY